MCFGPRLEATRHVLGEPSLTLARQARHHFPKQGRSTTARLGCRRCEPLLALPSKPTKFLADHHKQSICRQRRGRGFRTTTSHPAKTGMAGKFSKSPWPLIRRLHEERFGPRSD